ncbi:hypothetical protein V3C99_015586 [Haemonchus contortus]|uniref:SCP domain-containing protein n=1 Tax=Haemonchus contortus TaxID=6289 RepID=A0A7I4YUN5_HAECO
MLILLVTVCLALLTPSWVTATYCPPDNGMTDEVRAVFVYQHNHYRSLAARGQLKNKLGGYVPKAARMKKVGYDCEVEKNMMEYAKKCIVKHNPEADRNYWGQNLWATGARNMSKTHAAESAVAGWISEVWTHGYPLQRPLRQQRKSQLPLQRHRLRLQRSHYTLENHRISTASCPGLNNGMTDEVREMFLNRHNNYRSLIASGRAMNKLGGFAPKAARMMKMGVDAWFSELYKIGVPQDNVFTNDFFTRGTTEYSQLAWQTSNKIGCAVVSCWNAWTAVACEYNPW